MNMWSHIGVLDVDRSVLQQENEKLKKRIEELEYMIRVKGWNVFNAEKIEEPQITITDRQILDAEDAPPIPTTFEMLNELEPRVLANRLLAIEEKLGTLVNKKLLAEELEQWRHKTLYQVESNDVISIKLPKRVEALEERFAKYVTKNRFNELQMEKVFINLFEELQDKVDIIWNRLESAGLRASDEIIKERFDLEDI